MASNFELAYFVKFKIKLLDQITYDLYNNFSDHSFPFLQIGRSFTVLVSPRRGSAMTLWWAGEELAAWTNRLVRSPGIPLYPLRLAHN